MAAAYCPFCGTPTADAEDCAGCGCSAADRVSVTTETEALPPTQVVQTVDPNAFFHVEHAGPQDPTRSVSREALKGDTAPLGGAPRVVRHTPTLGSIRAPDATDPDGWPSSAEVGESLVGAIVDPDVANTHEVDVSPTYDEALRAESKRVAQAPDRQALELAHLPTRALPVTPKAAPPTQLVHAVVGEEEQAPPGGMAPLAVLAAGLGVLALLGVLGVVAVVVVPSLVDVDPAAVDANRDSGTVGTGDGGEAAGVAGGEPDASNEALGLTDPDAANEEDTNESNAANETDAATGADVNGAQDPSAALEAAADAAEPDVLDADAVDGVQPGARPKKPAVDPPTAPLEVADSAPAAPKPSRGDPPGKATPGSLVEPRKVIERPGAAEQPNARKAGRDPAGVVAADQVDAIFVNPEAVRSPWVHRAVAASVDAWGVVRLGGIDAIVVPVEPGVGAVERTGELTETLRVLVTAHAEAGGGEVLIIAIEQTPWLVWRAPAGAPGPRALEIMPLLDADLSAMARFESSESLLRRWAQLPARLTDLLDLVALRRSPSRVDDGKWLFAADAWLDAKPGKLRAADLGTLNGPAWRTQ